MDQLGLIFFGRRAVVLSQNLLHWRYDHDDF
jgi:hypothetical protein